MKRFFIELLNAAFLLFLILCLWAVAATAQELGPRWEWMPSPSPVTAALYGSTILDEISTRHAMGKGYVESNKLLGDNPWRRVPLMLAATWFVDVSSNYVAQHEGAGFQVLAWVIRGVHIGGHTGAAVYNFGLDNLYEKYPWVYCQERACDWGKYRRLNGLD